MDRESFMGLDGHLYLRGEDVSRQRARIFKRDRNRCKLKLSGCMGEAKELDHKQGGLVGRCDCEHNLQSVCSSCHILKHNRIPKFQHTIHGLPVF